MKNRIVYIVSDSGIRSRVIAYEWYAKYLTQLGFHVSFIILNGNLGLRNYLSDNNHDFIILNYKGTGKIETARCIIKSYRFLKKTKTSIVHCHYFDANLIGLIAAFLASAPKRIYTRHHGNLLFRSNLIEIQKRDRLFNKLFNKLATDIIAPSKTVQKLLILDKINPSKVHLIHHGFEFNHPTENIETRKNKIKAKYKIPPSPLIIGVVASYDLLKGHQFIIQAFKDLLHSGIESHLVLANAHGPDKQAIHTLLQDIPTGYYTEIPFEEDITSLYSVFNIFIHTPAGDNVEAFGQVYIEAMAMEIPTITTKSGIGNEFLVDKENTLVVPYQNSQAIFDAIMHYIKNKEQIKSIIQKAKEDVTNHFDITKMATKLQAVYIS